MIGISLSIGLLLFSACSSESTDQDQKTITGTEEMTSPHDLILNDGEKWVIDAGMKTSLDSLDYEIQSFSGSELEDYVQLSELLSSHLSNLISSCTMKGTAHDQLHKWLYPFMGLNTDLKESTSLSTSQNILSQLDNEIDIFKEYFQ